MPKVIYLTGAPASGKSSTTRLLEQRMPALKVWEYGKRLTEHCASRPMGPAGQDELRSRSSEIVRPEDVEEVDRKLLHFVEQNRGASHVLIDSHPVTKEAFGFRITPFSLEQFAQLRPDEIWVFYAGPAATRYRIQEDPAGRPMISEEEARMHTMLQASVAATYSSSIGAPTYLFDTEGPRDDLLNRLVGRLS